MAGKQTFEQAVKGLMDRNPFLSETQAQERVAAEQPALYNDYRARVARPRGTPQAQDTFEVAVAAAVKGGMNEVDAAVKVAKEHPKAYAAYRARKTGQV